jgi:hypothetical protein
MRIYYYARHTAHKAGQIYKVLHNCDEELKDILLTEGMNDNLIVKYPDADCTFADAFYDEYGWDYVNHEYNYVEGNDANEIIGTLTEDIRVWSRRSFNAERMWQIRWRENIIADLKGTE